MNRRGALRLLLSGGGAAVCGFSAVPWGAATAAEAATVVEVAPGLHVRPGVHEEASPANADGIANTGFVVGRDAVAVIDPGGGRLDGERLRAAVRAATRLPIRYVIITHVHPDHAFGAAAFAEDKPVFVGHARLPGALAERATFYRRTLAESLADDDPGDPEFPTLLVAEGQGAELDLGGGRTLLLRAHRTAHTDNDLTVLDQASGTLWAADLLFVDRVPSLDGSLRGWLSEMEGLRRALPPDVRRAVPGHGPPLVPWPDAAAAQDRYLSRLQVEVRAAVRSGRDMADIAEAAAMPEERDRWALFDAYHGRNATLAYKEIEWE